MALARLALNLVSILMFEQGQEGRAQEVGYDQRKSRKLDKRSWGRKRSETKKYEFERDLRKGKIRRRIARNDRDLSSWNTTTSAKTEADCEAVH